MIKYFAVAILWQVFFFLYRQSELPSLRVVTSSYSPRPGRRGATSHRVRWLGQQVTQPSDRPQQLLQLNWLIVKFVISMWSKNALHGFSQRPYSLKPEFALFRGKRLPDSTQSLPTYTHPLIPESQLENTSQTLTGLLPEYTVTDPLIPMAG